MDTVSPLERSRIMTKVKSGGNKSTEAAFASLLRREGVSGWRRRYPLEGSPDFVFPQKRLAVFVDGCLWHGCAHHCRVPHTHRAYWVQKIARNRRRDKRTRRILRVKGWRVIRIWEHEIKTSAVLSKILKIKKIRSTSRGLLSTCLRQASWGKSSDV
jgi:DNA mismatch endonuclease, patch repair protein